MLKPLNFNKDSAGTALVELKEKGTIETPDAQFKSFSRGVVISVNEGATGNGEIVGQEVFFEEYKDSAQVEEDEKLYAFIALEDIKGFRNEQ